MGPDRLSESVNIVTQSQKEIKKWSYETETLIQAGYEPLKAQFPKLQVLAACLVLGFVLEPEE